MFKENIAYILPIFFWLLSLTVSYKPYSQKLFFCSVFPHIPIECAD